MSNSDDIFGFLSFGTSFNTDRFSNIKKLKKGKRSKVTRFIGDGSGKIKSSFYPKKTLNFFKDDNYDNPKGNTKNTNKSNDNNSHEFTQEDSSLTDKELMKKYKINIKSTTTTIPPLLTSLNDLTSTYEVRPFIIKNLKAQKFSTPMPVQMQAIPVMMNKMECVVAAPTGSGKTLSYIIPILRNLKKSGKEMGKKKIGFRALIIVPTGLLVEQLHREFMKFTKGKAWTIRKLSKNVRLTKDQINSKYNDILISTPNKLVTYLRKGSINLSAVENLIMDEADKLFDMGFIEHIDEIISACSNSNCHRALYSATVPLGVEHLAKSFLRNPITITIGIKNTGSSTIDQQLMYVTNEKGKILALRDLFFKGLSPPVLIFVNTIERAVELYKLLIFDNYHIDYITSKRNTNKINEIIQQFRIGKIWALICTDIMARGLDVLGISVVINYDFPKNEIEYIHRIGRTGRAGKNGQAVTFYVEKDYKRLRSVLSVIKRSGKELPEWLLEMEMEKKRKFDGSKNEEESKRKTKKRKMK